MTDIIVFNLFETWPRQEGGGPCWGLVGPRGTPGKGKRCVVPPVGIGEKKCVSLLPKEMLIKVSPVRLIRHHE